MRRLGASITPLVRAIYQWRLGHCSLLIIIGMGVVASGIAFVVQIGCIDRGRPVYQPVQTLVAIMASIALGEEFYLVASEIGIHLAQHFLGNKGGKEKDKECGRQPKTFEGYQQLTEGLFRVIVGHTPIAFPLSSSLYLNPDSCISSSPLPFLFLSFFLSLLANYYISKITS
ncbi:hypothetical protein RJT34_08745 [Clitoria ternatea]|uniref:Uncharacterized protein n=1 Tax=Clitoria ternatea TaxID=43366 RepID=A0AAN9PUT1_CLITE